MSKYTLHLSNKVVFEVDEADFEKFKENAPSGNFITLKQGMINPSFVVAIIPVKEAPQKKVDGYIDEKTGAFVVTGEREVIPELRDAFSTGLALPEADNEGS